MNLRSAHAAPRTLHVIGSKGLGGAERFFIRLVNALAQAGAPVATFTVANGEIMRALDDRVRQYHAPMLGGWDLYSRWKTQRAIADFQPDVVQTYMGRATRVVKISVSRLPVHLARLGGFYRLKHYRHAHAWVGNTHGIYRYLTEHGLPSDRVHEIGNFVDIPARLDSRARQRLRMQWQVDNSRLVLGLGRFHPNKGWEDLLEAFSQLPETIDGQPVHLLMVGDGPLRHELLARSEQLGIARRVRWLGWQKDPSPYYQIADVFVCASVHEPLGNVILEAWANRVRVVSTRAQGPLELIREGVNGLLAPVSDPAALAEAIHHALTMKHDAAQQMIEAGYQEVAQHYSQQNIVSAYLQLYRDLRDARLSRSASNAVG